MSSDSKTRANTPKTGVTAYFTRRMKSTNLQSPDPQNTAKYYDNGYCINLIITAVSPPGTVLLPQW